MKKDNFFKRAARWVARMFGYKAESKLGRIAWHVFTTSAAIVVLILAAILVYRGYGKIRDRRQARNHQTQLQDEYFLNDYCNYYVSPYVILHNGEPSFIYNTVTREKTIIGVQWICKSDDDSLTFYCKENKRGYFNMFTGEPVIPAKYEKAWVFSDGVAWVMDKGELHLIGHDGKDVINETFPYSERIDSYCFHNGLCPLTNRDGLVGFINKRGEWVIEPQYHYANYNEHGCWMAYDREDRYGMIGLDGQVLIPFEFDYMCSESYNDYVYVRDFDHVDQVYDYEGHLVNDFNIQSVYNMEYESDEIISQYDEIIRKEESANCNQYVSSDYHYGLIDKSGNIITKPLYRNITAIAKDRYLCSNDMGTVILNDKGQVCGGKQ
jgi:hypothetical protein